VERVIPEIVTTDKQGYKGVQYSQLTAHLTEAVKELAVQNEGLQEENNQLRATVDSLVGSDVASQPCIPPLLFFAADKANASGGTALGHDAASQWSVDCLQ
jgi:hypothetical protein